MRLAHAGTAWGDAALTRDDVRIELDEGGRATITHAVTVHVSGKRFRAFNIDGVEDAIEPPRDDATLAGRDGPGWPAVASDAKGQSVEAFIEPAKEPRKLRVRLGHEGVPRGDYTVQIRYHVDFAKLAAFSRDGAMTKITWSAPRWPEGYDGAKIVIVVPAAKSAPTIAVADVGGEGEHPLDGFGLVVVRRGPIRDELEITRPHVPAHDDARFVLRVDPHALPNVPASAAAIEADKASPAPLSAIPRARTMVPITAGAFGLLLALLLYRRDRDAATFRPLIPGGPGLRGLCFGLVSAAAIFATWTTMPLVGALLVTLGLAIATTRAPRPEATRSAGRWLAIPEVGIPTVVRAPLGPLDVHGRIGKVLAALVSISLVTAFVVLLRKDHRAAIALAINATLLLPLFATGSSRQLPPNRVADAWRVLAPIAASLDKPKIIARSAGRSIDEVRLRLEPGTAIRTIEIGCGVVHGPGGSRLVPELLVRVDAGTRLSIADEHVLALGRTDDERTVCIRPTATDPQALRARVAELLAIAETTRKPVERAAA